LVVLDPEQIIDRATFEEPATGSEGMRSVLDHRAPVAREGTLQDDVRPGRGV